MRIDDFDHLLRVARAQGTAQRLLVVLLRAQPHGDVQEVESDLIHGHGALIPVMATDIELTPELRLHTLAEQADHLGYPWDLIMVSSLSGRNGRLASSEDAAPYLEAMAEAVLRGEDLSRYAVFDRAGSPVVLHMEGRSQ